MDWPIRKELVDVANAVRDAESPDAAVDAILAPFEPLRARLAWASQISLMRGPCGHFWEDPRGVSCPTCAALTERAALRPVARAALVRVHCRRDPNLSPGEDAYLDEMLARCADAMDPALRARLLEGA